MDELEAFKTEINLTEYAAAEGYVLDRKASSRNSVVMRSPAGDKIIIARGGDRHWIYFSVHDDADNGTIIDFLQNRRRCTLGHVRQALRPWLNGTGPTTRPQPALFVHELEPVSKDRARVLLELARMKPLLSHPYLEQERCIPPALLRAARFVGRIKVDTRANVIFPHAGRDGPCGYEIKNRAFTGFARGGDKGLWFSAVQGGDTALVIAESGIDALSYAALHPDAQARYASTGGAMNPQQPDLIRGAIEKMGQGSRLVIAADNDPAGRTLAGQIEAIALQTGRRDFHVVNALPPEEGADWNNVLLRTGLFGNHRLKQLHLK